MKTNKKIIVVLILFCGLISLSGCGQNKEEELKQKVITELEYVNLKIIDMLNVLNNISFENYTIISEKVKLDDETQKEQSQKQGGNSQSSQSDQNSQNNSQGDSQKQENESQDLINTTQMITDSILAKDRNNINWDIIKPEIELLNESWSIIILDLYSLNTNSDTILDFSNKLNTCIIEIKNENKEQSLIALADLYSSIPIFLKEIEAEESIQKIRQTQSYVINAYSLAEDMNNIEINNNLTQALETYSDVLSNIDYTKDKTYKTNKVYVLLNELVNSIDEKDPDVFFVQYKNFMEAINTI